MKPKWFYVNRLQNTIYNIENIFMCIYLHSTNTRLICFMMANLNNLIQTTKGKANKRKFYHFEVIRKNK